MNGPAVWTDLRRRVLYARQHRDDAVVAGGCIRDWMLGLRHKDIDIFLPNFGANDEDTLRRRLEEQGLLFLGEGDHILYEGAFKVLNYNYRERYTERAEEHTVQIILLPGTFLDHFATFDYNMVKAYYDKDGLHLSKEFANGLENRRVGMTNHFQMDRTRERVEGFIEKVNRVDPGWVSHIPRP